MLEKTLTMQGMRRSDIIEYFNNLGYILKNDNCYSGDDFQITVKEEKNIVLGAIKVPSTEVIFTGNQDIIKSLIDSFRMRFLSAGG